MCGGAVTNTAVFEGEPQVILCVATETVGDGKLSAAGLESRGWTLRPLPQV